MSLHRTPGTRAKFFGLFLLQLVLAGAAPYADARLEAEATHVEVHFESESTSCGLVHDHFFCSVCRALDVGATPVLPAGSPFDRSPAPFRGDARLVDLRAGAIEAAARSPRAPPSV